MRPSAAPPPPRRAGSIPGHGSSEGGQGMAAAPLEAEGLALLPVLERAGLPKSEVLEEPQANQGVQAWHRPGHRLGMRATIANNNDKTAMPVQKDLDYTSANPIRICPGVSAETPAQGPVTAPSMEEPRDDDCKEGPGTGPDVPCKDGPLGRPCTAAAYAAAQAGLPQRPAEHGGGPGKDRRLLIASGCERAK